MASFNNLNAQINPQSIQANQQVKSFDELYQLEKALLIALQQGDKKAIAEMLDKNFEYVSNNKLEQFNTSTQFVDSSFQKIWQEYNLTNFSLRTVGETRLVSFYLQKKSLNRQRDLKWSVQDYWVESNGSWKLLYRFTSEKNISSILPPAYINQEIIDKRF